MLLCNKVRLVSTILFYSFVSVIPITVSNWKDITQSHNAFLNHLTFSLRIYSVYPYYIKLQICDTNYEKLNICIISVLYRVAAYFQRSFYDLAYFVGVHFAYPEILSEI